MYPHGPLGCSQGTACRLIQPGIASIAIRGLGKKSRHVAHFFASQGIALNFPSPPCCVLRADGADKPSQRKYFCIALIPAVYHVPVFYVV